MFHENKYLNWYIPHIRWGKELVNLHASGMPSLAPEGLQKPVPGDPWTLPQRLEASLARWLGLKAEEVVFTPGATGGTLLALLTLGGPDSRILVEQPIYEPMLRQAQRLGPVQRLKRTYETGWQLPLDEISMMMRGKTSVIVITEPHNPSGICAPREQVMELAGMADRLGAVLLVNEVYRGFSQTPSYSGAAPNLVVVSSLSKFFGTYWARLGWLSGSEEMALKLRSGHRNMGHPSAPGAALGLNVMKEANEYAFRALEKAGKPLAIVDKWVRETPNIDWHLPQGPGFGTVRLPEGVDDMTLAGRLYNKRGVLLVPGTLFEIPGTVRISWLAAGDRLDEGLKAVAAEIEELRNNPNE